eukprot:m.297358 g.297358  ORF g.297358 m.297358 type:complete len:231 (-) comp16397_c0_seq6:485-1177(-)
MEIEEVFGPALLLQDAGVCFDKKGNKFTNCTWRLFSNGALTMGKSGATNPSDDKLKINLAATSVEQDGVSDQPELTERKLTKISVTKNDKTKLTMAIPSATSEKWMAEMNSLADKDDEKLGTVLYEDGYCRLHEHMLVIKYWYFPTGASKKIPISNIHSVIVPSKIPFLEHKAWGMAIDFNVWWASDLKHAMNYSNRRVIVDARGWPKAGFSCDERSKFTELLKGLLRKK